MADETATKLRNWGILIGILLAIASPVVSVTKVSTTHSVKADHISAQVRIATAKAEEAKAIAEKNARDFEYFKGEMSATMKAHRDSLDKVDGKMDKVELKIDEMMKIIVRFERVDDGI